MKHPALVIGGAAVAVAAIFGGSAVAVAQVVTHNATPVAATSPAPAPTKTVIKKVHDKPIFRGQPQPIGVVPAANASGLRLVPGSNDSVWANSNTSDAFALNVAQLWNGYPGTQMIFSPVTDQNYAMTYTMDTATQKVTATGGNGAEVVFTPGF